jgi:predicted nucleotidyltransferase
MARSVFPDCDALAGVCRRYHIRRLSLFGSTLRGSDRPESDVDLLVEFEPEARPSILTMARIESNYHRCWVGAKWIRAQRRI